MLTDTDTWNQRQDKKLLVSIPATAFLISLFLLMFFAESACHLHHLFLLVAGPSGTAGSASDSLARGPRFGTRSGHILSFLLPLIQEGQLSVNAESMYKKYLLIA